MKSMKLFSAAALVFGLGLGISTTATARIASCTLDASCMSECAGPYFACHLRCCV